MQMQNFRQIQGLRDRLQGGDWHGVALGVKLLHRGHTWKQDICHNYPVFVLCLYFAFVFLCVFMCLHSTRKVLANSKLVKSLQYWSDLNQGSRTRVNLWNMETYDMERVFDIFCVLCDTFFYDTLFVFCVTKNTKTSGSRCANAHRCPLVPIFMIDIQTESSPSPSPSTSPSPLKLLF